MRKLALALFSVLCCISVRAETITIAVASNFAIPMRELAASFEQATGHEVRTSIASTGVLYAAIANGARYDALLAADEERPRQLELNGLTVPGSRFTYAIGRLELWSVDPELTGEDCRALLDELHTRRLAIANPVTAPYGTAARTFLENAGLWERVEGNVVYGQNIAQALQFVVTRNASLGLIARALTQDSRLPDPSCRWSVPAAMHEPIVQQAVLLEAGPSHEAAQAFLDFLRSEAGREIIQSGGYEVPG